MLLTNSTNSFVLEGKNGICVATPTKDGVVLASEQGVVKVPTKVFDDCTRSMLERQPKSDMIYKHTNPTKSSKDEKPNKKLSAFIMFTGGALLAYWQRGNIEKGISKVSEFLKNNNCDFQSLKKKLTPSEETVESAIDKLANFLKKACIKSAIG